MKIQSAQHARRQNQYPDRTETEQGGNLIVKEQWLENPEWNIYVLINSSEAEELEICIRDHRSTFIPYLGKNDHIANIEYIGVYDCQKAEGDIEVIDSLALVKENKFIITRNYIKIPYFQSEFSR